MRSLGDARKNEGPTMTEGSARISGDDCGAHAVLQRGGAECRGLDVCRGLAPILRLRREGQHPTPL